MPKKIGGATAASLKGLKRRGASLRRNHEAKRDREAIQSRNVDRKRIGLWQLRLKYRGERLASRCVPKGAGRCGGDFKHEPAQQPYPKTHGKIGRPVSRRILYHLNLNPKQP